MGLKPLISAYHGHNAGLAVYHPTRDDFYIIEFDKLASRKHYVYSYDQLGTRIYDLALKVLEDQFDIPNDFSEFSYRTPMLPDLYRYPKEEDLFFLKQVKAKKVINHYKITDHHSAHAYSAYCQSGFKKAFILTYDGGGDDTTHRITGIDSCKTIFEENQIYTFGEMFNAFSRLIKFLNDTHSLDRPGKLMGLAAFGNPNEMWPPFLDKISCYNITLEEQLNHQALQRLILDAEGHIVHKRYRRRYMSNIRNNINPEVRKKLWEYYPEQADFAASVQKYAEEKICELFNKSYRNRIEMMDGNVIISGGTALNVLINEKLKREFPEYNFYVPSNPHDGGLALGQLYYRMATHGLAHRNDYKLTYAGPKPIDLDQMETYKKTYANRKTDLQEVAKLLKEGNIIGFIQGRSEIGPRALGARSILADASYPGMKDIINAKVKKREEYRPFAPACRYEDAYKYFYTTSYDNMEAMAYVADVKDEYKEQLSCITHADGTARLQTVKREDNEVFYDLLSHFGGVVLNTSFNMSGKPTLQLIRNGLSIKENTELDYVVVQDIDNSFVLFT